MKKPNAENVLAACNETRTFWQEHGIPKPVQFFAFCLSLLPLPVISPAAKALEKHLSDKASAEKFAAVYAAIAALDPDLAKIASLEEAVQQIAKTVASHAALLAQVEEFTKGLGGTIPDFQMLTEDHSYQALVNCIVEADFAQIVARNYSENLIENTSIEARQTHLHASGNSRNVINGAKFNSKGLGKASFNGMACQQGDMLIGEVSVNGGVGGFMQFADGASLTFGVQRPALHFGSCPGCGSTLTATAEQLARDTHIQCPAYLRISPITAG